MVPSLRHLLASFVLLLAADPWPQSAAATWPHDTYAGNLPLCTATGSQLSPSTTSDGAGGAIVVWQDGRGGAANDIYAQRVSATGAVLWTAGGVPVCTAAGDQKLPNLVSDGAGGAIIVWADARAGGYDLYMQRVSASGAVMWTSNGVPVCTAANDQSAPETIVSDGVGGAITVWADARTGSGDVYAQRVNSSGAMQWTTNGVALCTASGPQFSPVCISDGAGGAIAVWYDERVDQDIYAQRVSATGAVQWTANGVGVCIAVDYPYEPTLVSDGAGGAIIAWYDYRTGIDTDIYAQRLDGSGGAQWPSNGVALCTSTGDQSYPVLVSDGAGGAIVTWRDTRTTPAKYDVYAQRIGPTGAIQWTMNGIPICVAASDQDYPAIATDGIGGAIMLWTDYRTGTGDVYAQRVNSGGTAQWATNGVAVCLASGLQILNTSVASDGAGGVIVAWHDFRFGATADIYAQRVDRFGYLGAEPQIASVRDVPNDQGGVVKVSWYPSWLDTAGDPNLTTYDVYRSAPGSLVPGGGAARGALRAAAAPPPVYLPALYAWEYLGSVSAVHFLSAYGFLAPTTGDSLGGANPRTAFLVVGRNASGSMYWMAPVDSGYSVDNLAPGAVTPFSGVYAGGVTTLSWGATGDPDFQTYRLYRGTTAGFAPDPTNLLAQQASTGYVDVVGAPFYYKICAADVHGNAGPYSTVFPSGVVASDAPAAARPPAALALSVAPASRTSGVRLRWALPQAAAVRLTLHSLTGRRVRELVHGPHAAGAYVTAWDGRDATGTPVAAGLYVAQLAVGGRALSTRVLHVP